MRSAILVDSVLSFEIKGEHVHVTDEGGAVHLALTRSAFIATASRSKAVASAIGANKGCDVHRMAEFAARRKPKFREETDTY